MKEIKIKAPATTANLGPAFDCIGMALELFDELAVKLSDHTEEKEKQDLSYKAIEAVFRKAEQPLPPLSLHHTNYIPPARGLGSSAAIIACGLLAGNYLLGEPFSKEELIEIGAELEGHPDNIVPAILGGCQAVIKEDNKLLHYRLHIPQGLKAIIFIPDFFMPTKESRQILPPQISREDAVYNIGRTILLVAALFSGKSKLFGYGMKDRLHQPARKKLFPSMESFFEAALEAGASGACLSGSGSSILALSFNRENEIASALEETAARLNIKGKTLITQPTETGAHIVEVR